MSAPLQRANAARHGTPSGYSAHQNRGETPCDACYAAKAAYDKRWRSSTAQQIKSRRAARAQVRAYGQLAHRYPDEYRELYEAAKAAIQAAADQ